MTSACEATTRVLPGTAVIELSGEVDGSAATVLTVAYERAVGEDRAMRVVVLRNTEMSAPALTMDVRRVGETTAVVDIRGEVTAACEPVLMSAYEAAGGGATSRLVLNFAGLEYMNSGGIGMLVTLLVRANRQRQQLAAYGLSEHYREIFELTRLDEAITIYDSEESALSGVVR
jgi:anti-sigma B factor antagonist